MLFILKMFTEDLVMATLKVISLKELGTRLTQYSSVNPQIQWRMFSEDLIELAINKYPMKEKIMLISEMIQPLYSQWLTEQSIFLNSVRKYV
jgi:hypothetical protein